MAKGERHWQNDGLRVRLVRVPGTTPKKALKETFRFQVPPLDEFAVQRAFNFNTYDTIRKGQFQKRGSRQLKSVSFQTLAVENRGIFVVTNGQWTPTVIARDLERLADRGYPFLLQVSHDFPNVEFEMLATLSGLTVSERAGEPDARYFSVDFLEWRDPQVRRKRRGQEWPKTHKLDGNDTLHKLARKYYGKPSLAGRIAQRNRFLEHWGRDTRIIGHKHYHPGDKLIIPKPPRDKRNTRLEPEATRDDLLDARDDLVAEYEENDV